MSSGKRCRFCGQEVQAFPPLDFLCPDCWEAMHGRPSGTVSDDKVFMLAGVFMAMDVPMAPPNYTISLCARRLEPPYQKIYQDMEEEAQLKSDPEDPFQGLFEPRD